jgi:NSS family neurotransmitter:Na+ symporter
MKRKSATWLATFSVSILGIFCVLSTSSLANFKILGYNIFQLLENTTANILLPMGGLFIVIFVAWFFGRDKAKAELSNEGKLKVGYFPLFIFVIKFLAPLAIAFVFLQGIGLINLK